MSSIKFLLDFAKTGDLKSTLADFKALNSELQKNKSLQKDFGDSFTTATKSVSTNLDEIAAKTKKAHDALKVTGDAKEIARLTKEIAMLRGEYDKLSASTSNMLVKNEKLKQQTLRTDQQAIKTQRESIKLQNDKIKQDERAIKQAQKKATEQAKLNSIYAQESARLNDLRKKYKDMALSEGTASKEARILLREITALDAKLKNVDASVGQFQRNVGNYGSALKRFGSGLTSLLGIGGGAMLVRDAFQSFATFEQGLADLSAITGLDATGKEIEFLKQQSLELAKTSTASASEVLEAYKLIGSAQPELLKDTKALNKMAESFIVLADASGLELPEAVKAGTDIMNQFGLSVNDVDRVINTLAAGAKEGSAEIPDLSAAMLESGVAMKQANVEIEEGVAQIEALAARGIKGSEAGTKLRNVLTKLSAVKALPKEAIVQLEAAGVNMDLLGSNTTSVNDKLKELEKISGNATALVKVFGLENQTAASILIDSRQKIEDLTGAVTDTDEAFKQAGDRTGTVGQEFTKLKNTFEALVIEFIDGGGDFAGTLRFIRENLETIITVVGKVVKGLLIYKGVQMGLNAFWKAKDLTNYVKGILSLNTATRTQTVLTKEAMLAQQQLNRSMNANIIGLITVAVIELADALGFFESEADRIAAKMDRQKAQLDLFQSGIDKVNAKRKKDFDDEISTLESNYDFQRRLAEKNGEDLKKIDSDYLKSRQAHFEARRDDLSLAQAIEYKKYLELDDKVFAAQAKLRAKQKSNSEAFLIEEVTDKEEAEIEKLEVERKLAGDQVIFLKAERKAAIEEIKKLNDDGVLAQKENIAEVSEEETKANEKAKQEREKRLEDEKKFLEDRLKNNKDYQRKLAELEAGNILNEENRQIKQERLKNKFAQQDIEEKFRMENETIMKLTSISEEEKLRLIAENKAIETQLIIETEEASQKQIKAITDKFAEENAQDKKDAAEEVFESNLENLDKTLKITELELLKAGKTQEEIELALLEKKAQILEKEIELRKAAGKETLDTELELARLRQQILDEEAARVKKDDEERKQKREEELDEIRDFTEKTIELSFQRAEEQVENNIDGIEKEIDAQEQNIERQRELAAQGLENTLAFEKQVQAENEAPLIEEQKRLEKIKKIETYFNLLSAYAQEDPNSAPAKALAQIAIADAIAARLEDGGIVAEEVAKQNGGILKGKSHKQGGILIEAEGDEGLLSKKEMRNLGTGNFRTLKKALSHPVEGNFMKSQNEEMMAILPQQRMMVDFSRVEKKLENVEKAINNKPVPSFIIDKGGNLITKTETAKYVKHKIQKRPRV